MALTQDSIRERVPLLLLLLLLWRTDSCLMRIQQQQQQLRLPLIYRSARGRLGLMAGLLKRSRVLLLLLQVAVHCLVLSQHHHQQQWWLQVLVFSCRAASHCLGAVTSRQPSSRQTLLLQQVSHCLLQSQQQLQTLLLNGRDAVGC
jgi:hypothetical protein